MTTPPRDWEIPAPKENRTYPSYEQLKATNVKLNRRLSQLEAPMNKELSQAQRLLNEAQNKADSFQRSRDNFAQWYRGAMKELCKLNHKYNKLWWRAYYHRAMHLVLLAYGVFATAMWLVK